LETKEKNIMPIGLVDTGFLIDLEEMTRDFNQRHRPALYTKITDVLAPFEKRIQLVVSPAIFEETKRHANIWINAHRRELSPEALGLAQLYLQNFNEWYNTLDVKNYGEQAFQNWSAAKILGSEMAQLKNDMPSEVDVDTLRRAADFVTIPSNSTETLEVVVFSSDGHLSKGVELLNMLGYDKIKSIHTRYHVNSH
jgi:hypothetical protein